MDTPEYNLTWTTSKPRRRSIDGGVKVAATICGIALLLFLGFHWPQRISDAAHTSEPATAPELHTPTEVFQYFPAQYRNSAQSGATEEHIQAF